MDLDALFTDTTAEERLSTYRMLGIKHAVLIVPFESLSGLAKQAALTMAGEWGHDPSELRETGVIIEHANNPTLELGNVWLKRIIHGRAHPADVAYWIDQIERWAAGDEADPRLDTFRRAWRDVVDALPPVRPAGFKCRCASCAARRSEAHGH